MASNSKSWGFDPTNPKDPYVCLFVSRNKDNADVPDFKERRRSFLTTKSKDDPMLVSAFDHFVSDGVDGEMSRMYYSVNVRDSAAIYKQLVHFLIDNPDFNLCAMEGKIAGIAAKKECAKTKHWMFDFDINDESKLQEFISDLQEYTEDITYVKTPNGYAVITEHGFDSRELLQKWSNDVTLKRDDLICVRWARKRGLL